MHSTAKTDALTTEEVQAAVAYYRKHHGDAAGYLVLCRPGLSAGLQLPIPGLWIEVQEMKCIQPGTIQVYPGK
jgi:hypothetical protein